MGMRIEGGAELAAKLRAMPERVSRRVQREALTIAAEPIREHAASIAPRRPGAPDLAEHIVISNARSQEGGVAIAVGPSTEQRSDQDRRYDVQGVFVEYGTNDTPAQAFLRPALDTKG